MKSTFATAVVIAVVLLLWLGSGQFSAGQPDAAEVADSTEESVKKVPRVRTEISRAELFVVQVSASGNTQAKRSVQVKAETSGRVVKLPVEKGAVVERGDILCELAIEDREIRLEKAKASLRHAKLEHAGIVQLSKEGLQAEVHIASALVNLTNARANLKTQQLDLAYLTIRAPFRGIVQGRPVDIGDFLQKGNVCAEILDPDPMLVVAHISERDVDYLEIGGEAEVEFSRKATLGTISFISHAADPITRTYRIEIEIVNADFALRDGLSAKVLLPQEAVRAHRVTPALLSLNDAGEIGIKIVDERNEVKFVRVDIVSDTTEGIWLTGLPQSMQVITLGQGLVFDGQVVDVVTADAMTALKANLSKAN